ncbi:MAG: hypothetical protein GY810_32010 [Aureispira sp.]|nr:hypothetical protein [Aureispira sp.]
MSYNWIRESVSVDAYYITQERGAYHLRANNADSARYYFNYAKDKAKQLNNDYLVSHAYNDIGYSWRLSANQDSAIFYLDKGIQTLVQKSSLSKKDSVLYSYLLGNIGDAYMDKNDVVKGGFYLNADYGITLRYGSPQHQVELGIKLLGIYGRNKRYNKFEELTQRIENTIKTHNLKLSEATKVDFFKLKLNRAFYYKDIDGIKGFVDSIELFNTRIIEDAINKTQQMGEAQARLELIRLEKERELNDALVKNEIAKSKNERLVLYLWIVCIITVLLAVVFWYRRKMGKVKHQSLIERANKDLVEAELKINKLEKQKLEQDLNFKKQDLTNLALENSRKNDLNKEFMAKLKAIKKGKQEELNPLIKLVERELLKDQTLELIQTNIDELNTNFFNTLQDKFPNLTTNEMRLCSLVRLGLNNKEISVIRGISSDSAKVSRYRLKKKLELDATIDLMSFLKNL